jgi:HEAT repeat protein
VLGTGAVSILFGLSSDPDGDVRIDAIQALVALQPEAARGLLPRIRRQLRSPDYYAPTEAMWAIASLHDTESIADIEEAARDWEPTYWKRAVAEVVLMFLRGDVHGILQRIRDHDHLGMPWLLRAAALAGTEEAIEALESCARTHRYDDECGPICANLIGAARKQTRKPHS